MSVQVRQKKAILTLAEPRMTPRLAQRQDLSDRPDDDVSVPQAAGVVGPAVGSKAGARTGEGPKF